MSKLLPFLVAGVGASSVSVGGVFMLKKTGGNGVSEGHTAGNTNGHTEESGNTNQEKKLVFEDVSKFKEVSDASQYECLKDNYFGKLNIKESSGKITDSTSLSTTSGTFFKTDTGQASTPYQSCLLINWKKTTYGAESNAKGHGKFTGLGTFVRGDEGFINFNVAETQGTPDKKLKFSGVFYLVGKTGDNWEVKHKKEVTEENKTSAATGDNSMFPKKGTSLKNTSIKPYWDFLDDNGKLDNVCQEGSCGDGAAQTPDPTTKIFSGTGSTDTSTSDKLKEGCENTTWWTTLFGSDWDLGTKLKDFKGTGKDNSNTSP